MKKVIKKEKVNNRGAPVKSDEKKVNPYHLREEQWQRIVDEASVRNVSPFAFLRQVVDWYLTALDTARVNSDVLTMLDKEGLSVKVNDGK